MYWAAARLQPRREALALHCLKLAGYRTYFPRLREHRTNFGRRIEHRSPLFPGYAFVQIELQWHTARWSPGIIALILDGDAPARVPDKVIAEIRGRERAGLIELPPRLKPGARVRVTRGPLQSLEGLCAGQGPRERVLVLLQVLGAARQVALPAADVERVLA
jgi:transcriptional antiterminator RfaH